MERRLLRIDRDLLFLAPGTFITEWDSGAVTCEAFLKDEESYRVVADRLVSICHCYGFDGWLINIENALSVSHSPLAFTMATPTPPPAVPPVHVETSPCLHLRPGPSVYVRVLAGDRGAERASLPAISDGPPAPVRARQPGAVV